MSATLREHNARALDRILLEHYGGKVGRGLAVELTGSDRQAERLHPGGSSIYHGPHGPY
jgi:hypothetical protein